MLLIHSPLMLHLNFAHILRLPLQIVAYNKMDIPESSDYWEDVREGLLTAGVPETDILSISAVSGQGVVNLVRHVRALLDALPTQTVRFLFFLPVSLLYAQWYRLHSMLPAIPAARFLSVSPACCRALRLYFTGAHLIQ